MADKKDLYEILGVSRDADRDAIRKAYRKLARQNHPDLNPGDKAAEERFKDISKAWEVLEDAEKRRNYDEFGEVSLEAGFDPEKARQAREAFGARFGFSGQPGAGQSAEEFHFGGIDDGCVGPTWRPASSSTSSRPSAAGRSASRSRARLRKAEPRRRR
jgi:curved DNA-binding protein CbpA